jgi:hypothetical protein
MALGNSLCCKSNLCKIVVAGCEVLLFVSYISHIYACCIACGNNRDVQINAGIGHYAV